MSVSFNLPKVTVLGGGRMGAALAAGWRAKGVALRVVEPSEEARNKLTALGARCFVSLAELPREASDLLVLAVKPGYVVELLRQWQEAGHRAVVLSIAAGVRVAAMRQASGMPVVRCMPNLPAQIGEGVFGAFAAELDDGQLEMVHHVLSLLGPVVWLDREVLLDAVTALSGSGPAYVFAMIEAMQAAGEKLGLGAEQARVLAVQTVKGAALLAAHSQEDAAELRRQVTSPNGTTQAALEVLMRDGNGLGELIQGAMQAAARRSGEMGR